MSSVNVSITGHLADTPELRQTEAGRAVTNFTILANERRFDDATQSWVDAHKTAVRVTAWGRLAENLVGTIGVGHEATVTGSRLTATAYIPPRRRRAPRLPRTDRQFCFRRTRKADGRCRQGAQARDRCSLIRTCPGGVTARAAG